MTAFKKRRKTVRFRGSKTHGYGAKKKHRGAGSRGGRGNAGTGKRSDNKKPSVWKEFVSGKDPSKRGFTSWLRVNDVTINVGHLASSADRLVAEKKATVSAGVVTIDLTALGYTKLLSSGTIKRKLHVTVAKAASLAVEKVQKAGGTVTADVVVDKEAVKTEREAKAVIMRKKNAKTPPQAAAPKKEKIVAE